MNSPYRSWIESRPEFGAMAKEKQMIAKSLQTSLHHHLFVAALWRRVRNWLLALGLGQDGPAGQLPEEMAARRR